MKIVVRLFLIVIFIFSISYLVKISESRYGDYSPSGPFGFGLVAGICVWSFIYFECNYAKPKQDNLKNRWSE
jgi:hypothetical protein